ncbi:hypothetical protein IW261DRAFT_1570307 [Armillaria novae-zelandiae]|uniref:Uncharacterized protein n=1 Tax=Armillaria novae-zelandiae TaxID=153914 RepID=A0AA39U875_9AGAR|nr:hypothetical protein IW261DRAFT_1570307 [Armillaria novae-zelandiae]
MATEKTLTVASTPASKESCHGLDVQPPDATTRSLTSPTSKDNGNPCKDDSNPCVIQPRWLFRRFKDEPQTKHNSKARKILEDEQQETRWQLAEEIESIQDKYHQELRDIGTKYGRSFKTIINYVLYSPRYKNHHAPSLYLAKVSAKAEEVNKDQPIGDKIPLHRIQEMVQEEQSTSHYEGLTQDKKQALLEQLEEKQTVKVQGAQRSNVGTAEDCHHVMIVMSQEINGLAHRTGAHFVSFMPQSDIHNTFQPTLVSDSPASLIFFKRVVGISAEDILIKFEQFLCAHSLSINSREDLKDLRVQCTKMISKGFDQSTEAITGESNICMNYTNYDTNIVAHHHVKLDGQPIGIKFEKVSNLKNLQDLHQL